MRMIREYEILCYRTVHFSTGTQVTDFGYISASYLIACHHMPAYFGTITLTFHKWASRK